MRSIKSIIRSLRLRLLVSQSTRTAHSKRVRLFPQALEERSLMSAGIRPIDEVGNNAANPSWGTAGTDLIRLAPAAYGDGIDSPALASDQNARAISNILNSQANPSDPTSDIQTIDQNSLSDFGYAFGQFIDHDLDLTPDGGASLPITVAAGDPIGPAPLPFTRSITDPSTGTSTSNPAQQVTDVTAYLDLSQVYGSDAATAADLRTFSGGLLKTSPGNMLPYDNSTYFTPTQLASLNASLGGEENEGGLPTSELFVTGDIRGNENLELTALETLFVRNHNLLAGEIQKLNPSWTDEQIYQEARKLNIAEYQSIVYNEWIPAVFGPSALPAYSGYRSSVDPAIANEFSTVAFRFGHSLLSGDIERQTNQGLPISTVNSAGSDIPLSEDFFDPNLLNTSGAVDPLTDQTSSDIGAILKGDADGNSQAMDTSVINEVRDLLFGNFGAGGQDLVALDVQRGRDHGIPDYNALRVDLGLPAVTSFAQITSNSTVQKELEEAYPGGVNTIDAFEGGLAEDHVPGSDVGPLFQAIIVNQFERLRDGDRFFYLNEQFTPQEMKLMQGDDTLTGIIESNTNITNLQTDAFIFEASISGMVTTIPNHGAPPVGVSGITVLLEDTSGDILATTKTGLQGQYFFNQQSGTAVNPELTSGVSATGYYTIVLSLPTGVTQTSVSPGNILISRGDTNVMGVNFTIAGVTPPSMPVPPPQPGPGNPPPPIHQDVTTDSTGGLAIPIPGSPGQTTGVQQGSGKEQPAGPVEASGAIPMVPLQQDNLPEPGILPPVRPRLNVGIADGDEPSLPTGG